MKLEGRTRGREEKGTRRPGKIENYTDRQRLW